MPTEHTSLLGLRARPSSRETRTDRSLEWPYKDTYKAASKDTVVGGTGCGRVYVLYINAFSSQQATPAYRAELFYSPEELEGWTLFFELKKAELRVGRPWRKEFFLFVVHPAKPRI